MDLRLREVGYGYAGTTTEVLRSIDLDVDAGKVVGLVGPNDAGKSTLCLVASGLAPTSIGGRLTGSVTLDGVETVSMKPFEAAQRCGILFQNPLTQLSGTAPTVFEEVAFGPRNIGLDLRTIVERVEWVLDVLNIGDLAPRDPARLSGGQAQLVALAAVLAIKPGVLVLDEPTSQLDPAGTHLVGDALANLANETGTAILVAEHKTDLLARMADTIAVLDGGALVEVGPAGSVLGDAKLSEHGVEPPAAVAVGRAIDEAGVRARLDGIDLATLGSRR
ncbi:MAG: ABC transporter ATP-binding protein [Chloroflexi bacterium]|nr:ABC transporter ATP-binding protein [Chloroflexota bacterium]